MTSPIPVLLLFGPTASGKTAVLEELFTGPRALPAEVVSADSMQVYRGMDLGTAKPGRELLSRLSHHLIDIRNPNEQFHVGDFVRLADELCPAIWARGALPVLSGGTAFYLKTFLEGLPAAPEADLALRCTLEAELVEKGALALHTELGQCDPVSAGRIHPNDHYRILRALEVCRSTGRPLSSFPRTPQDEERREKYRVLSVELERPREELYRRIDERCRLMFTAGLPGEVQALVAQGYGPEDPGLRAIGYREFFGAEGTISDVPNVLPEIEALVARNSRRYAKRQITFFHALPSVYRLSPNGDGRFPLETLRDRIERFLS